MAAQSGQPATMNGTIPNGTPDHSRKSSVVISAPNGAPVSGNARNSIVFGQATGPQQGSQAAAHEQSSLPAPENPGVISPAHSPSPIPQPAASGGRPPSGLQNQGGLNFMAGDGPAHPGQGYPAHMSHERRPSSQSMQSTGSNMGRDFSAQAGRGRGGYPQQYNAMGSPAQAYRQLSNSGRPGMGAQFSSGNLPPNAQYNRPPGRNSPAVNPVAPQMPHGGYGYQQPQMYMQNYDPYSGHYQPYPGQFYGQYPGQGPSPSPRPQYPTPFAATPGQSQPPFMPPMARTPSQASDRPGSSIGHPGTPSQASVPPSVTSNGPTIASSNFVKPVKKSNAIKITNDKGEAISFGKPAPSPSTQQPSTPVIVSTPNAPTPPPRAPSATHSRTESKPALSQEETREAFKEQMKRQMEEKRRQEEGEKPESVATNDVVKEATAGAEKAAAHAAGDAPAEKEADAAIKSIEETDEERKAREEREEEERIEREIAEMEAAEKEEEERERAFQEKRKKEKEEAAKKQAESDAKQDEELKRQEREAEAKEEAREKELAGEKTAEPDDESKALFANLKRPTLGPGAGSTLESTPETPAEENSAEEMPPPPAPTRTQTGGKQKPAHLKLETNKKIEPAEPTPGMQALKTSRFLELQEEARYPEGIRSPNPALNNNSRKGRAYDKDFLLQFQNVFKEKPSVDWDQKVRDTLGPSDEPGSARPQSSRTPSSAQGRSQSQRGQAGNFGAMGSFSGNVPPGRTLPAGTTSHDRFMASSMGSPRVGMPIRQGSNLGMPGQAMLGARNSSFQAGGNSPRQLSSRGSKTAKGNRQMSKKEESEMAARMPLTAGGEVKALEKSSSGWTARSIGQGPMANAPSLDGHMQPDMVQRKVKAALNKMTPEKFDKISDQILEIASQSKNESDGRTLRQVIQLTFEKACDESHWAGMYAKFCSKMLTTMSGDIRDETIRDKSGAPVVGGALFRKYLLNRCQEEFERGWQANLPDKPEGETEEAALLSEDYYIAAAAKRRGLGLIQFIGQLYKLGMLTGRIMHECVMRLLNFEGDPDEAAVENLTTLLKSVGSTMDNDPQGHGLVDTYFQRIEEKIMSSDALPSRPKFMIMDLMDLRRKGWQGKDDTKGPKTITQIHAEAEAAQAKAEAERQRTRGGPGGRPGGGRQDSRNFSGPAPPPVDYSARNVGKDDLARLANRSNRGSAMIGPGGNLGPSSLGGGRTSSRRGLGPGSGNSTRTSTPPVGDKDKKDEPAQQNAFSALENLDTEETEANGTERERSKSPMPASTSEEA